MKNIIPQKVEILKQVHIECDLNDDSTEYMIQMMMDRSGCSHDQVIDYLISCSEEAK